MATYTYPISTRPNGDLELSPARLAILTPAITLNPGDTLVLPAGNYQNINAVGLNGSSGLPITIDATVAGAYTALFSNNHGGGFNQPEIRDSSFLTFKGIRTDISGSNNFTGIKLRGNTHDLLFQDCEFRKFTGNLFEVYDSGKTYNGTKASGFYNITWDNCVFSDLASGSAITAGLADLNAVCFDFEIKNCTFSKISASGSPAQFLNLGYMFNVNIHHNLFEFLSVVDLPTGHNASIVLNGYGDVHHNRFGGTDQPSATTFPGNNFGNEMRHFPICSTLTGYNASVARTRMYNNLAWNKRKYPFLEENLGSGSANVSGSGGLLGLCTLHTQVHHNTVYKTRATRTYGSTHGDATYAVLNGALIDAYTGNIDYNDNVMVDPEVDERTSGTTISDPTPYIILFHNGPQSGVIDGGSNVVYKDIATANLNTSTYAPLTGSPVIDAATGFQPAWITDDLYGTARPQGSFNDLGAVEYIATGTTTTTTSTTSTTTTLAPPTPSTTPVLRIYESLIIK